jgi:hypothetical protein
VSPPANDVHNGTTFERNDGASEVLTIEQAVSESIRYRRVIVRVRGGGRCDDWLRDFRHRVGEFRKRWSGVGMKW